MEGAIIAIVVVSILAAVGLVVGLIMIKKRNENPIEDQVETAVSTNEFMPFETIENSMICFPGHVYKALIEVSSLNLGLCSSAELERIQDSYYSLMDSVNFPFAMYIITKEIDNEKMCKRFEEKSEEAIMRFPQMTEYHNAYLAELENITEVCQNSKQKKKYIVLTYDEANQLDKLSDDEKFEQSARELFNRCRVFLDGLAKVGLAAHILNSNEIAELLYSCYHKESLSSIGNILEGDYDALIVEGKNCLQDASAFKIMDLSLVEAMNSLKENILNSKETTEYQKLRTKDLLEELEKMRDEYSGYYKEPRTGGR